MNNFWRKSLCQNQYLHRFNIVEEYPDGVVEECEICHKHIFSKIIDGKVNNLLYMDWHIRQALPSFHPYYYHEYSYDPLSETISPYV